ncbi:YozE family protein [Ectobacillus polymachus]|uniref:YozE family protein n=1 Tax=Ectobacillus polymachus TaxID=1508806 RepID=UPI003A85DB06
MSKSFYHYMMKYRNGSKLDPFGVVAKVIYEDHSFPKQSTDYDEISSYLETSGLLATMTLFDEVWDIYIQETLSSNQL